MGIAELLADIGEGLGTFLPSLVKAMVDGFVGLFFTSGAEGGAITGLSAVGIVSLTFFIVGLGYKAIPTIAGWLKLKARARKKRRAK